jgi:hypothetical protein
VHAHLAALSSLHAARRAHARRRVTRQHGRREGRTDALARIAIDEGAHRSGLPPQVHARPTGFGAEHASHSDGDVKRIASSGFAMSASGVSSGMTGTSRTASRSAARSRGGSTPYIEYIDHGATLPIVLVALTLHPCRSFALADAPSTRAPSSARAGVGSLAATQT